MQMESQGEIAAILIKDYRLKGCMPTKITGCFVTGRKTAFQV
jgi:hypothetical protein